MNDSILTQDFIDMLLAKARKNLLRDGYVEPVLFIHSDSGQHLAAPVDLPEGTNKSALFESMGRALRSIGLTPSEAVFLAESWVVETQLGEATRGVVPSQDPRRIKAITLIGRDANREKFSMSIQMFERDGEGQPVLGEILEQVYESTGPQVGSEGLLDYLFEGAAE